MIYKRIGQSYLSRSQVTICSLCPFLGWQTSTLWSILQVKIVWKLVKIRSLARLARLAMTRISCITLWEIRYPNTTELKQQIQTSPSWRKTLESSLSGGIMDRITLRAHLIVSIRFHHLRLCHSSTSVLKTTIKPILWKDKTTKYSSLFRKRLKVCLTIIEDQIECSPTMVMASLNYLSVS